MAARSIDARSSLPRSTLLRSIPRRRLAVLAILVALAGWTSLQAAREAWRAVIFDAADPWPAEAPVLWTVRSGHVERLEALAVRVGTELPDGSTLAVTPAASLGVQRDYLFFWLAFLAPEHDVRLASTEADVLASDAWLVWPDGSGEVSVSVDRARLELVARADGAELYRLRDPRVGGEP